MKKYLIIFFLILVSIPLNSKNLEWEKINLTILGKIYNYIPIDSNTQLVHTNQGLFIYENFKMSRIITDSIIKPTIISNILINRKKEIIVCINNLGFFKFDNEKWINISFNLPIKAKYFMCLNDEDDLIVIYNDNENLQSSTSILKYNSKAWETYTNGFKIFYCEFFNYNNKQFLYNSDNYSMYVSNYKENGFEWSLIDSSLYLHDINSMNIFKNKFYVYSYGQVLRTLDIETKEWKRIGDNVLPLVNFIILITNKGEIILYSRSSNGIYYSNDGGNLFERNDDGMKNLNFNFLKILKDGKILALNNKNEFFISNPPKNIIYDKYSWSDRINFKELYASNKSEDEIELIKLSEDGRKLYVVRDSSIKTFDFITGGLLDNKTFSYENSKFLKIFIGDSTISTLQISEKNSYSIAEYKVNIYDINNYVKIRTFLFNDSLPRCPIYLESFSFIKSKINYSSLNDKLFLNVIYRIVCNEGSIQKSGLDGKVFEIKFLGDSITKNTIYDEPTFDLFLYENSTIALNHWKDSWYYSKNYQSTSSTNDLLITSLTSQDTSYLLRYKNYDDKNNSKRFIVNLFDFRDNNQIIARTRNKYLYRWNLSNYTIIDSILLDDDYNEISISSNLEYLVTAASDGIKLFKFPTLEEKLYEEILNSNLSHQILFLPDFTGFLIATGSIIRYFEFSKISNLDNHLNTNEKSIFIFPSPATDYITINLGNEGLKPFASNEVKVEIYDVMGVKIQITPSASQPPLHEGNLKIDVSNLAPGVYFLKIVGSNGACSIVEKFVKM